MAPDDGFPAGCSGSYASPFEITVAKVEGEGMEVRDGQHAFAVVLGLIVVSRAVASAVAPDDGCPGGCSNSMVIPLRSPWPKLRAPGSARAESAVKREGWGRGQAQRQHDNRKSNLQVTSWGGHTLENFSCISSSTTRID